MTGTPVHAANVTWDGSEDSDWDNGLNWDNGTGPIAGDVIFINSGMVEFSTGDTPNFRALRLLGGTLAFSGGIFDCAYNPSWDSHVEGTLHHTGTTAKINELEVGRTSGDNGFYYLSGGSLRINRGLNGYSLYLGGNKSGVNAGTGTMEISGGSMTTRTGVKLGDATLTGTGHFAVLGSATSEIGIAASTGDQDGTWVQHTGSTLTAGIDYGGVTTIFLHDSTTATSGTSATFEQGTFLDVDYYNGATGGGTWTVMEVENGDINVINNGLAFAPGVDTNVWSFNVDNSGPNGILTVTAQGDPVTGGESFLIEAEAHAERAGTQLEVCQDVGDGQNVSYISNGDWCKYENIALGSNARLNFRVARPNTTDDGHIEIRLDATDGMMIGLVDVPVTDGWQTWETISTTLPPIAGVHDIYLVFVETGTANGGSLFNLNWWSREEGPTRVEAEAYSNQNGVLLDDASDIGGGQYVGWIDDGDWSEYTIDVETTGYHKLEFRVASDNGNGMINIVSGTTTLGSVAVGDTGGWQSWTTVSTYVDFTSTGSQTLRLDYEIAGDRFNVNWFSFEPASDLIPLTVGNTPQQQMRYGMDYERLWSWSSSLNNSERDLVARWTAVDADVDFVRVAMNCGYELTEGTYNLSAYTNKIIPLMQEMQQANPNIKFFASPRPLNEAVSGASWQPYPIWVTGATTSSSGDYDFSWQKCSEYLVRYLLLMKSYGFKISFLDVTNEWQSNGSGGRLTQDDMDNIHNYLHVTYMNAPWPHPALSPTLLLEPGDIPEIVAPSSWSYSQGTQWINNLDSGDKAAISIAASHNTDRTGDAQTFANAVHSELGINTEIWNTEIHGWKSTSGKNETTSFYFYIEAIRAGFGGINGWLAIGKANQGHSYILNPSGTPTRNVKYHIYRKLSSTSNYGHALDIIEEPDDLFHAPYNFTPPSSGTDTITDDAIPRNVAAFIKGNLMTVWVVNENATSVPLIITPSGRTIATTSVRRTRWTDPSDVEGFETRLPVTSNTSFFSTIPAESVCCFEIVLDSEDFSNDLIQAEDHTHQWGTGTEDQTTYVNLSNVNDGEFTRYGEVALSEDSIMSFSVARPGGRPDGIIEIREGSSDGPLLGQVAVPVTGHWQSYQTVTTTLDVDAGIYNLYLKFAEDTTTTGNYLFNLDWFTVNEPATPPAPTGLAATAVGTSQVDLSWNPVAGATGYNLKRSTSAGGPYTTVGSGVTSTSFSDLGRSAGTQYHYVVSTVSSGVESLDSPEVDVFTLPGIPVGLTATSISATQIDLSWNGVFGALAYQLKRSTDPGGPYTVIAGLVGTSRSDTGLSAGVRYYYVVNALNSSGVGMESDEVSAVPSAPITEEELVLGPIGVVDNPGGGQDISLPLPNSVLGHLYQAQTSDDLSEGSWENVGAVLPGNGGALLIEIPINPTDPRKFYRFGIWRE